MGLLNKDTPSFEDDTAAAAAAVTTDTTAKPSADAKAAAAVAKPTTTAVVIPKVNFNVLDSYKDAMRVEYNTLSQLTAQQGNLMDRETKAVLGDQVVFGLLSWQDSFVVSPEDDDAPDDVVKYSEDGITCTDSDKTLVADALADMKLTYPKACVKQRAIVVGAVESASKIDTFNGKLVQLDLSPASRTMWKRYMAEAAYAVSVNKRTPEEVSRVKVSTRIAQGAGNNSYTLAEFSVAG